MLVDRYETEDLFSRVPRMVERIDPVLKELDQLLDDEELYQQVRAVWNRFMMVYTYKTYTVQLRSAYCIRIDCWNTSQVFKASHRIGLEISSSAFPKYDRNLNTGAPLGVTTEMVVAEQRIYHDAEYPSVVVLPIIPRLEISYYEIGVDTWL